MQREFITEKNNQLQILRHQEIKQIETGIRHQEYIVVSAAPQGGLTTFFDQAIAHIKQVSDICDYLPIPVQATQLQSPLSAFFALHIAETIQGPVKDRQGRLRRLVEREKKGLDKLFQTAFGKSSQNVVFFIDDFHALDIEKQRQFVRDIRQLHSYKASSPLISRMLFILGGALSWRRIDPQRISPFSNAASKIILKDFDFDKTMNFISQLFKRNGYRISEISSEYIYEVTEGHPYFTSVLCKMILAMSAGEITFRQIDKAVHDLIAEGDSHLRNLRDRLCCLAPEELTPLIQVLQGRVIRRSSFSPDPKLENLILMGILIPGADNRIRLRNSLYSKFLRRDPVVQNHLKTNVIAPDEILCDPLVAANKEGYCVINRLENELRNLIVSQLYLHFQDQWLEQGLQSISTDPERDQVNNKAERELHKVLPLRQKKEQADISLPYAEDPVIGYATLKELQAIVVKNWKKIFKPIIVSQDRFVVYLTILNRIRNKLAHNRRVTDEELQKLHEIETSFRSWLSGPL